MANTKINTQLFLNENRYRQLGSVFFFVVVYLKRYFVELLNYNER